MNHRKRGGGKVIIKRQSCNFLLTEAVPAWEYTALLVPSHHSKNQQGEQGPNALGVTPGKGWWGENLETGLTGLFCNLQSATGHGHIVSRCQRVQNYHLCGAVPVYPKWTTQCHIFPISIIAYLYFEASLIKDNLKLLYTSLYIVFAVSLKMQPH